MSTIKIDLCYNIGSQQKQQRTVCCLTTGSTTNLVLLLLILVWLGFSGPVHGVIKNQRVILSDLHLPNSVSNGNNSSSFVDDVPDENEGSRTRRTRPKRTLPTGGDVDEIRRKAITFGQSEKDISEVNLYMERLKALVETKHPTKSRTDLGSNNSPAVDEIKKELSAWNSRRMSDFSGSRRPVVRSANPEENDRHYEGDIVLTVDQAKDLYEHAIGAKSRRKRKFIGSKVRRWDSKKPIYFSFDGSHTLREQRIIELALEHWHNITCLNFERRNNDELKGNRIIFTDVDGCASNVGKHPLNEPQFVSLAPECIRLGVIAHEVAHALGFWHEQSRPDRDFYVQVQWDNIDKDSKGQFTKEQPVDVDSGGVAYDYGSIMHYRSKAFAKYDDLYTLSTYVGDYQRTIGQRDQLSFNDIRLMNTIYCKDACPRRLPCQRGGYTDPRRCDRCRCPDGFTGILCDQVMPGYGAECGGRVPLNSSWVLISSPNYPTEFKEGQECSWLFEAPLGQQVQFNFIGDFEMYCKVRHSLCMDYVEIKNSTDFANTGMRYCCFGTPKSTILSSTRDLLVLFRSFYRGGKGFQGRARAIPSTGTFGEWSAWSECSANCGGCGVRRRTRICQPPNAVCLGDNSETEICGHQPCRGICTSPRKGSTEDSDCAGILAFLKNAHCKIERVKVEECDEICCSGFSLNTETGLCTETGT